MIVFINLSNVSFIRFFSPEVRPDAKMSSVFKIPYTLILSVLSRDVVDHLEEVFEGIVELYRAPYLLNKCTTQTYRLESRYLSNNVSRTSTNISGG